MIARDTPGSRKNVIHITIAQKRFKGLLEIARILWDIARNLNNTEKNCRYQTSFKSFVTQHINWNYLGATIDLSYAYDPNVLS